MDRREAIKKLLGGAALVVVPKLSGKQNDEEALDALADQIAEKLVERLDANVLPGNMETLELVEDPKIICPEPSAFESVRDNSTSRWIPYFTTTTSRASWNTGASSSLDIGPVTSASGVVPYTRYVI
jgi:hypothetical protein